MYERMIDKSVEPTQEEIKAYIGCDSVKRLNMLESAFKEGYCLSRATRFPFGASYGWGYKYNHKSAHLCYAFFERGAFTVTLQIGDRQVPELEKNRGALSPKALELWENRYPCGENGGWVHYRVLKDDEVADVVKLVNIKKRPA